MLAVYIYIYMYITTNNSVGSLVFADFARILDIWSNYGVQNTGTWFIKFFPRGKAILIMQLFEFFRELLDLFHRLKSTAVYFARFCRHFFSKD